MATWNVAIVSLLVYRFLHAGTTFVNYGVNVNDGSVQSAELIKLMVMSFSSVVGRYLINVTHNPVCPCLID